MTANLLHTHWHGTPSSEAVVLLHGFMGHSEEWAPFLRPMNLSRPCLTLDLPGHGGSTGLPSEAYGFEQAADMVRKTLDHAGVRRFGLYGYSMGGRLALFLALTHPERVSGLVIESATAGISDRAERTIRAQLDDGIARRLRTGSYDTFLEYWYGMPMFASLHRQPDVLETMLALRRQNDPVELARALEGMSVGRQPSLWERLDELVVPTTVLAGSLDTRYVEAAGRMTGLSKRIKAVIVPDTGHNIHLEQPEACRHALRERMAI